MIQPRYFVVYRDEEHLLEAMHGSVNGFIAGCFNGAAIIDGENFEDFPFWQILSKHRKEVVWR